MNNIYYMYPIKGGKRMDRKEPEGGFDLDRELELLVRDFLQKTSPADGIPLPPGGCSFLAVDGFGFRRLN